MGAQAAFAGSCLGGQVQTSAEKIRRKLGLDSILGCSKSIQELRREIELVSSHMVSVLICGESGTGKELAARAIHYLSNRADKSFIPVNCGAIPDGLFENELFGHVRGAFTDARTFQTGLVQEAEEGTLFLDEISAISAYNQVKLLRFLEDGDYKCVGDPHPRRANVRIVAATNKDLRILVKEGAFRDDLYYRLNVVMLTIPPLRERIEDIPVLVEHFLRKYSIEYGRPVERVSNDAMRMLLHYQWPGNVRELENRVQNMILMNSAPVIDVDTVKIPLTALPAEASELECFKVARKKFVDSFEKTYLIQLLSQYGGNVASAAGKAGKSRTGLWNLIRKHNISPKTFRPSYNEKQACP
jgi:two-component system response regulator GlrR